MLFPLSPLSPGWFELHRKTTKMVDYQTNLELWLQDASLFRDEPIDSINIDDFFSYEKADTGRKQTTLAEPGLEWFDEKVDLSVLDPNGLPNHRNETQPSMEDDTAFLLGLLDSSFNPSYFGTDDVFKNEDIDFTKPLFTQNFVPESTSSEVFDTHLASPQCNLLQVNSPPFFSSQSPASPYSDISDANEESSSNYVFQSPESSSVTSNITSKNFDSSRIHVTVCDNVTSPFSSEPVLSIDEVSHSVRKRKFVNSGEEIPKVKVILSDNVPKRASKPKDRRERKKVQNKEAAARYRIKKRMEEKELSDEVAGLESDQQKLQEKHDELQSEIKYLKSLMCEILRKRGIMK